jgi:hypothetical protein
MGKCPQSDVGGTELNGGYPDHSANSKKTSLLPAAFELHFE